MRHKILSATEYYRQHPEDIARSVTGHRSPVAATDTNQASQEEPDEELQTTPESAD